MSVLRLAIKLAAKSPSPPHHGQGVPKKPCLLERVQYAIDCFQANHQPEEAFEFLRTVNDAIRKRDPKSLNDEQKEILLRLRPLIEVFGAMSGMDMNAQHDVVVNEYKEGEDE